MRSPFLLFVTLSVLLGAPALAKPEYPTALDAACLSAGRTPSNPAELARASGGTFADCALCHDFNLATGSVPSSGNVNADGMAWKNGNLDPFCVAIVTNQPPVLDPIGNQAVNVGETLLLPISASDPDSASLTFFATGLPADASFVESGPASATFSWTPAAAGNVEITFEVSDGIASDSETVVITVGAVNAPPELAPIGDQSVPVGETLVLGISALDPEGGPVRFAASGLPAEASLQDFGDGSAELVFTPTAPSESWVTIEATDAGTPIESASESFMLRAQTLAPDAGPHLASADWIARRGVLVAGGDGALAGSSVAVVDAASEAVLAVTQADAGGAFAVRGQPFLAPCAVRARDAGGMLGDPLPVQDAPADCGSELFTRASARWRCTGGGTLLVRGGLAPLDADLRLLDATTDAELAVGRSDSRGRFGLRAHPGAAPASVSLVITSGAGEWSLGPIEVRDADLLCTAPARQAGAGLAEPEDDGETLRSGRIADDERED